MIDKNLASGLLARNVEADPFVLSTGVDRVALDFATPKTRWLKRLSLAEARRYYAEGQFDEGSVGPEISAMRVSQARRHSPGHHGS